MSTRREFVTKTAAAGLALVTGVPLAAPKGQRIKSAVRRDETALHLGGMGDNYHMTWAADDRQFVAVCDGLGWASKPRAFYNSRLYTISGDPGTAVFDEVEGYPELITVLKTDNRMRYYGFGTLAADGHIYQYLSTPNHHFTRPDATPWPGARFVGAKLIYSPNNGRSWHNHDGSTPVLWESWTHRSRENMIFFEEPQEAFSLLSILQMGKDYSANKDGYAYVYAPNGNTEGTMNELVMFRVQKDRILHRSEYQFLSQVRAGRAQWTNNINERAVIHSFPRGWVNSQLHPWAWMPSVTYNAPLDVFMMASWGTGNTQDGLWFNKPSYLGLWISKNPWGPWSQIHEETAWTPRGDNAARAFAPQISPKWISDDGRSFWLVWSDFQQTASPQDLDRLAKAHKQIASSEDSVRYFQVWAEARPYYAFNVQRFDLIVA